MNGMANTFTKVLSQYAHVGWEHLAELHHPGVTAKIAAVRAGDATTATLPARIAARLIRELPEPEAATAGDTRTAVTDALAVLATEPRPVTASNAARRLFTGDIADIAARIEARRSALSETHVAAWAELDHDTADQLAAAVLANTTVRGAAMAFTELSVRHRSTVTERAAAAVAQPHQAADGREAESVTTRRQTLADAVRAALAAWLRDHTTIPDGGVGGDVIAYPHHVPEAAGEGLAALAGCAGVSFCGPTELARIAMTQRPVLSDHTGDARRHQARTAASSGVPWAEIRASHVGDRTLDADDVIAYAGLFDCGPAGRACALEMLRAEIPQLPVPSGPPRRSVGDVVRSYAAELGAPTTLRLLAAAVRGDDDPRLGGYWLYPALAYLCDDSAPTRSELTDAAANDPVIDAFFDRIGAVIDICDTRGVDHENLDELWERFTRSSPLDRVQRAAVKHPRCAAVWARHCDALVAASGADPASVWAAAAALAEGFDGTTAELIDVAAATTGN